MDRALNSIFRTLIYISSFSPLLVMMYLNNLNDFSIAEMKNTFFINKIFWILFFVLQVISSLALVIWLHSLKKDYRSNGKKFLLTDLELYDGEVINYFVTYLIPLLSLKVGPWPSIVMNFLFLFVVGIYFVKNNTLHFNIILLIAGYHIYGGSNGNIVITKKKLYQVENGRLKADQVGTSNIFYID